MDTPDIALGAIWYLAFLFSTTCHEAAHALVAKWGGDLTAFEGGQVTLNPVPHIMRSPFGMVVMPILSYVLGGWMIGWASAPYDPSWQRRHPHRSAWMALAGPAANFTLMLLSAGAIRTGIALGRFIPPTSISGFSGLALGPNGEPTFATSALSIFLCSTCCWAHSICCRSRRWTATRRHAPDERKNWPCAIWISFIEAASRLLVC